MIQAKKMTEVINLNNQSSSAVSEMNKRGLDKTQLEDLQTENRTSKNEEWQVKRNKRSRRIRLGTNKMEQNSENKFTGQEKKAWFFINRVKSHVTETIIEEYIRNKPGFKEEEIEVKELEFERKKGALKSFLVKVAFLKKDELYNPEFWPENVGIKRFNFQVYEKNKPAGNFL